MNKRDNWLNLMHAKPKFMLFAVFTAIVTYMLLTLSGLNHTMSITAGLTLLIAIMWVTEALPIPVTSLIPFVAFPAAGVLDYKQASSALGSHVILLLMGAFMLSKALEKSGVHHRLALYMLRMTGAASAKRLVLAFMLTSAILSMWISNTATALMLLPIAMAIVTSIRAPLLATAILLGIAYGASLGGVGSPVGTPPNIIFMSVYQETTGLDITFLEWMKTGLPIVLLGIPIMAFWLTRNVNVMPEVSLPPVGAWSSGEKRVLSVFAMVACAWIFRPYYTPWLGLEGINDSTIALAGVVAMCIIPNGDKAKKGQLLDWDTAQKIPWGMLLLFAGGICLAKAFAASGLSGLLGEGMTGLAVLPLLLLIFILCLAVSFITEITSNTAMATLLMPILASASVALDIDPMILMLPATISASCAFMMPVATPTNAVVYGSGLVSIKDMAREGAIINVMMAFVATGVVYVTLL